MNQNAKPLQTPSLAATGEQSLSIQDFRGQPVVIYFYPRDNTPGCTREGQDFRDAWEQFRKLNCAVIGVSRDSLRTHENFSRKHDFPFPLIADTDEQLCRQFDVIREKNMYGKKVLGIERSTFLLDPDGRIVREWHKVKVPDHVDEVLKAVTELG